jgi:hypothetical protein
MNGEMIDLGCNSTITIGPITWPCTQLLGHEGPHFSQVPVTEIVIGSPEWTDEQAEAMEKVNDLVNAVFDIISTQRKEQILGFFYEFFGMEKELNRLQGFVTIQDLIGGEK